MPVLFIKLPWKRNRRSYKSSCPLARWFPVPTGSCLGLPLLQSSHQHCPALCSNCFCRLLLICELWLSGRNQLSFISFSLTSLKYAYVKNKVNSCWLNKMLVLLGEKRQEYIVCGRIYVSGTVFASNMVK